MSEREQFWVGDDLVYTIKHLAPGLWAYKLWSNPWRLTFSYARAKGVVDGPAETCMRARMQPSYRFTVNIPVQFTVR